MRKQEKAFSAGAGAESVAPGPAVRPATELHRYHIELWKVRGVDHPPNIDVDDTAAAGPQDAAVSPPPVKG